MSFRDEDTIVAQQYGYTTVKKGDRISYVLDKTSKIGGTKILKVDHKKTKT